MEYIKEKKQEIRNDVERRLKDLPGSEYRVKLQTIEDRLFNFANFMEARIVLFYMNRKSEVESPRIIERTLGTGKIVTLPAFDTKRFRMRPLKVDDIGKDLIAGPQGIPEPDARRCKLVPIDRIDIAIVPGVAFDEKGGRIGQGEGYYDRLIPKLPITTRKVSLALELQLVPQIPMETHDKYVDIIITENRVIYKI